MAATKFSFFVISTSDRGDFPRIIVIALFVILCFVCLSGVLKNNKLDTRNLRSGQPVPNASFYLKLLLIMRITDILFNKRSEVQRKETNFEIIVCRESKLASLSLRFRIISFFVVMPPAYYVNSPSHINLMTPSRQVYYRLWCSQISRSIIVVFH